MAALSISTNSLTSQQETNVLNYFALGASYQETIDGQPNPQSKAQFLKKTVLKYVSNVIEAGYMKSLEAQRQTLLSDAKSLTDLL